MVESEELQKQIENLEKRVTALECIINGTASGKSGRKPKLTPEQKQDIVKKHFFGVSYSELAKEYSVAKSTICNICKGCRDKRMITDVMTVGQQNRKLSIGRKINVE